MSEGDYILGTEADEIERLGLQHRVWRERVLDGWARAGIGAGQTVVDVGAGPGWASADLSEIVGPEGRVVALERSESFLEALRARALGNVEVRARDVSAEAFGEGFADATWCRWVLSFVEAPERTVGHVARALKPGGVAVFHEYADYGAWQMMPPDADLGAFRGHVTRSWRDAGGEPDAALRLPEWLVAAGLELVEIRPLIEIVGREDFTWQWPAAFMAVNARRLAALGYCSAEEAAR
ncbi:MAG TPA: methyltransferase domain-containing protein [Allosphingosinicella sp.]|jgi:SAM-dependent methyltransferase|nr:methyltransferase domain-containing protein [Allosphingosinicella sp.]